MVVARILRFVPKILVNKCTSWQNALGGVDVTHFYFYCLNVVRVRV